MGHFGLFSGINGSLLRFGYCLCCRFCYSGHSLWFPCSHYGHPKDLAETLPHPHLEGTRKGVLSRGFTWLQEYIVEDLHGCYAPPKLDPEHEELLKMLKLL
ncbi:hypothetical protein LOK49_LG03G01479 [Camellia lanceoleosa]|uniref:Uncharacterized protein n=1 Tax=Camellia lanceoleosa TaxID=1840588 RepID=A0ACC0IF54_9ERIC|nr:hypothetical protein LOK49_LG03G01479 [Camellia lanceoleosa]